MYPLRSLNKIACDATNNFFPTCGFSKRDMNLNVWQIPFKRSSGNFLKAMHEKLSNDEFFIACFWFCIATAVVGLLEATTEFARVYSDQDYEPKTFWGRRYRNIPIAYQRTLRLLGSSLNIVISVLLLYGFLNFRPCYMFPWIAVNSVVISLESFYWISSLVRNKTFKLKPLMSIAFMLLRLLLVVHMAKAESEFV